MLFVISGVTQTALNLLYPIPPDILDQCGTKVPLVEFVIPFIISVIGFLVFIFAGLRLLASRGGHLSHHR